MKKIYIVAILCALALPARAQTLYHVDSSDNVGEMLVNAVGSSQAAPYWIRITQNTGGYFARIGVPLLIVLRQIGYDSSFYQPFELDSVSQIVGDSLYVAKRVLSNSQKLYWPPGTLVEVVNSDGIIIKQLQQRIAGFGITLPDTVGKAGRFLQDSANGYGLVWSKITGGSSGVSSFNARTGGVVPTSGDYGFSQITGTAAVTQGGTGLTGITSGKMLYASGTNTLASLIVGDGLNIENDSLVTTSLPIPSFSGDSGLVLSNDGTSLLWSAVGSGTVTNVNVSGGTTGLTTINGPITTYGTITLGGTLGIANGGTNANTAYQALLNLLPSTIGHVGEALIVSPLDSSVIWDTTGGGIGSLTPFEVLIGDTAGTGAAQVVAPNGGGQVLISVPGPTFGTSGLPFWGALGVGASEFDPNSFIFWNDSAAGFEDVASSANSLLVYGGTGNPATLGAGSDGQVLTSSSGGLLWQTFSGGSGIDSIAMSGGSTGMSFSPDPLLTNGTITMSGTLALVNGGTGYSASSLSDLKTHLGITSGTVTSVGLSAPSADFTVTGSPVTTSGTLALGLQSQNANLVFAGPTSGSAATPGFRALTAADIAFDSGAYIQNQTAAPQTAVAWITGAFVTEDALEGQNVYINEENGSVPLDINAEAGQMNNVLQIDTGTHHVFQISPRGVPDVLAYGYGGTTWDSLGHLLDDTMANGQVLIGGGNAPVLPENLTAGSGITITNAKNSITIATTCPCITFPVPIKVDSGGTGLTNLTTHDVLVGNGTGNVTLVSPTTNTGYVLTSNGTGSDPTFQALSTSGLVTTFSAGSTGLTPGTATSGAITLAGILAPANGGTGAGAFTSGSIPYIGASGVYQQDNTNFVWNDASQILELGNVASGTILAHSILNMTGSANTYIQATLQNLSSGNSASSDFIVTANNGTDSTNYGDFGINNSGYSQSLYSAESPLTTYLTASNGNLFLGAISAGDSIIMNTATAQKANEALVINGSGILSLPQYGIGSIFASATGVLSSITPGSSGTVLTSNGATSAPTWQTVTPSFSGLTTHGVMYATSTSAIASTAAGNNGQFLGTVNGTTPQYTNALSSLGTANTAYLGLKLGDSLTASSGNQALSPDLEWDGNGYGTTNSTSHLEQWFANVLPIQGATQANSKWQLSCEVNGRARTTVFTIDTAGNQTISGIPTITGFGQGGMIWLNSSGVMQIGSYTAGDVFYSSGTNGGPSINGGLIYSSGTLQVYNQIQLLGSSSGTLTIRPLSTSATGTLTDTLGTNPGSIVTYTEIGSAPSGGTGTFVSGTATINTTLATANARIFVQVYGSGTVGSVENAAVASRVNGVSFTVDSSVALSTSTFAWFIVGR